MNPGKYLIFNDQFFSNEKQLISADNRSFRYGDGLFETMQIINDQIVLQVYHFERLLSSLQTLKFKVPSSFNADYLAEQIKKLAKKNKHEHARIRLNVFRGIGGLYDEIDHTPNYIIQSWQIEKQYFSLNKNGFTTDIYKHARKSCDDFSHIKTNNYLPYIMAAIWAKEKKLNDAILLNNYNRVTDATIANIFLVVDGKIKTPALREGCVGGVMRRHIIFNLKKENIPFEETEMHVDEIFEATELFFSNALQGIRWVKQCGNSNYKKQVSTYLFKKVVLPIFNGEQ